MKHPQESLYGRDGDLLQLFDIRSLDEPLAGSSDGLDVFRPTVLPCHVLEAFAQGGLGGDADSDAGFAGFDLGTDGADVLAKLVKG